MWLETGTNRAAHANLGRSDKLNAVTKRAIDALHERPEQGFTTHRVFSTYPIYIYIKLMGF